MLYPKGTLSCNHGTQIPAKYLASLQNNTVFCLMLFHSLFPKGMHLPKAQSVSSLPAYLLTSFAPLVLTKQPTYPRFALLSAEMAEAGQSECYFSYSNCE